MSPDPDAHTFVHNGGLSRGYLLGRKRIQVKYDQHSVNSSTSGVSGPLEHGRS